MRRGLVCGLIIGGLLGAYYARTVSSKQERRWQQMADEFVEKSCEVLDCMKEKAAHLMPIH